MPATYGRTPAGGLRLRPVRQSFCVSNVVSDPSRLVVSSMAACVCLGSGFRVQMVSRRFTFRLSSEPSDSFISASRAIGFGHWLPIQPYWGLRGPSRTQGLGGWVTPLRVSPRPQSFTFLPICQAVTVNFPCFVSKGCALSLAIFRSLGIMLLVTIVPLMMVRWF